VLKVGLDYYVLPKGIVVIVKKRNSVTADIIIGLMMNLGARILRTVYTVEKRGGGV